MSHLAFHIPDEPALKLGPNDRREETDAAALPVAILEHQPGGLCLHLIEQAVALLDEPSGRQRFG